MRLARGSTTDRSDKNPVRSRTEIRFGCREPGAGTFAELTTTAVLGAVLNGRAAGPVRDGRLELSGLAARNVLVVEAEVAYSSGMQGLTRFTDPADGATYLMLMGYPTAAPSVFCCFDQPDLTAVSTLSLVLPGGWDCVTNGSARERPAPGQTGTWRFEPVPGTRPYDLTIAAGPYTEVWRGPAGAQAVPITLRRRPSLAARRGSRTSPSSASSRGRRWSPTSGSSGCPARTRSTTSRSCPG